MPLTLETLRIIGPVALTLAIVGLLESLLTSSIVDEMTDTASDKNRESRGQGIANIMTRLFGGLPGCALIGTTFDWHSLRTLHRAPLGESAAMVVTVATVVATHNLALGSGRAWCSAPSGSRAPSHATPG